jgi:hypothetical protein
VPSLIILKCHQAFFGIAKNWQPAPEYRKISAKLAGYFALEEVNHNYINHIQYIKNFALDTAKPGGK